MTAMEKAMVLALVKASKTSKSQTLAEIGIPRRTYYNWVRGEKSRSFLRLRGFKAFNHSIY